MIDKAVAPAPRDALGKSGTTTVGPCDPERALSHSSQKSHRLLRSDCRNELGGLASVGPTRTERRYTQATAPAGFIDFPSKSSLSSTCHATKQRDIRRVESSVFLVD
jgi:hypothetical protein